MSAEVMDLAKAAIRIAGDGRYAGQFRHAVDAGLEADPHQFASYVAIIARDAIRDRDVDAYLATFGVG